jgi:hypothetical protein
MGRIKAAPEVLNPRRSLVPRYYFHVRCNQLTVMDQEGMELAGDIEAAQEAARRGREIAKSQALSGIPTQGGLIIVEDEWEYRIFELPLDVG